MKTDFRERMQKVLDYLGCSKRQFELQTGIGNGTVGKAMARNTGFSEDNSSKIKKKYPWINLDWLQFGHGEMKIKNNLNKEESSNEVKEMHMIVIELQNELSSTYDKLSEVNRKYSELQEKYIALLEKRNS